jgi:hypothetical protein
MIKSSNRERLISCARQELAEVPVDQDVFAIVVSGKNMPEVSIIERARVLGSESSVTIRDDVWGDDGLEIEEFTLSRTVLAAVRRRPPRGTYQVVLIEDETTSLFELDLTSRRPSGGSR